MTEKKSLSKLWREDGKKVPFAQFCQEFNFRNFVNPNPVNQMFSTDDQIDNNDTTHQDLAKSPIASFDKKQAILILGLGLVTGVVIGLVFKKQLSK